MAAEDHRQHGERPAWRSDAGRIGAFFRRDVRIAWSYRAAFVVEVALLVGQTLVLAIASRLVSTHQLAALGGGTQGYLAFAAPGMALAVLASVAVGRMAAAIRTEQLYGTLEAVLATPTRLGALQLGSTAYAALDGLLEAVLTIAVVVGVLGVHLHAVGIIPTLLLVASTMPLFLGLGLAAGGVILTLRRGGGLVGPAAGALVVASGGYFPLRLLPEWLQAALAPNPFIAVVSGIRALLFGTGNWSLVPPALESILPAGVLAVLVGTVVFRAALKRERKAGTLGLL